MGIGPGDFWDMTLSEINFLIAMQSQTANPGYAGRLTSRELAEIDQWMAELEEKDAHEPA